MKRFLVFSIFLLLTFNSCHTPSYTFTRNSSNVFQPVAGKYLINYIDAPEAVRTDFQQMLLEKLPENTQLAQNSGISIFPSKIPENPGSEKIKELSVSTGDFDYLVNIKANISSDNIDSMQIGSLDPSDSNETYVAMEIFDLNNPGTIFYSKVRAFLQDREDSQDFSFAVTSNTMLKKSLKKILRRIDKIN